MYPTYKLTIYICEKCDIWEGVLSLFASQENKRYNKISSMEAEYKRQYLIFEV